MLPSSCLSQVLLSLISPPPQTQARHVPFSETQKEMISGSFCSSVIEHMASMLCDPRSNPRTTRKEKGKRAKRVGEGEGRRVGN